VSRFALGSNKKCVVLVLSAAICAFLIIYLGGAINDAYQRYSRAAAISTARAHTRVGREGYEYIFEPNTQIFLDKILPNRNKIIANILLQDYLPIFLDSGCGSLDVDICNWMRIEILYYHDPTDSILRLILYASITAMMVGIGLSMLCKSVKTS
jgi:hypothetical protein